MAPWACAGITLRCQRLHSRRIATVRPTPCIEGERASGSLASSNLPWRQATVVNQTYEQAGLSSLHLFWVAVIRVSVHCMSDCSTKREDHCRESDEVNTTQILWCRLLLEEIPVESGPAQNTFDTTILQSTLCSQGTRSAA